MSKIFTQCSYCGERVLRVFTKDKRSVLVNIQQTGIRHDLARGTRLFSCGKIYRGQLVPLFCLDDVDGAITGHAFHEDTCIRRPQPKAKAGQGKTSKARARQDKANVKAESAERPLELHTSYYAKIPHLMERGLGEGLVPISQFLQPWILKAWRRVYRRRYEPLAPPKKLLTIAKKITWSHYTQLYRTGLAKLDPQKVIKDLQDLTGQRTITLLCYEKTGENCHRHIVSQWFRDAGIECSEVHFEGASKLEQRVIKQGRLFI